MSLVTSPTAQPSDINSGEKVIIDIPSSTSPPTRPSDINSGIQGISCFSWLWCCRWFGRNQHPEIPDNIEVPPDVPAQTEIPEEHTSQIHDDTEVVCNVPAQTEIPGKYTSQENNMKNSQGNGPLLDKVHSLSMCISTIGTTGSFTLFQLNNKGTGNETLLKAINVLLGASSLTALVLTLGISFTRNVISGKTWIIKLIFGGIVASFLSGFGLVLVFNMLSV